jgi:hypothetical protein
MYPNMAKKSFQILSETLIVEPFLQQLRLAMFALFYLLFRIYLCVKDVSSLSYSLKYIYFANLFDGSQQLPSV